jgi:hypothetical protein
VKLKAAQLGPTVRLVTLKELKKDNPLLIGSLGKIVVFEVGTTDYLSLELLVRDHARLSPPGGTIMQHEPSFRDQTGEVLSLNQIAQRLLNVDPRPYALVDGIHALEFTTPDPFVVLQDEARGPARLRFTAKVKVRRDQLDCDVLEYKQDTDNDPVAWVMLGETARPDNDGTYQLETTFRIGTDGRLQPRTINVQGLKPDDMFSLGFGRGFHVAYER